MHGDARPSSARVSPLRAWGAAISLAVGVFAATTTEMLPIGLVPNIASELGASGGTAGLSVTIYGIVAGLLAPAMTSRTRRSDRRALLMVILGVFVVGKCSDGNREQPSLLLLVRLAIGVFHGLLGLSYSAFPVLLQLAVFAVAPHAREAATSLYVLAFNVSIAVGSLVGAVSIDAVSAAAPIVAGAVMCSLSVLCLAIHQTRNRRRVRDAH